VTTAIIEIQYLPPLAYFSALSSFHEIIVEKFEQYEKQSYRNRTQILTVNGLATLTLPVTAKHGKPLITEVRIDYSQKWLNNHWRTIQSSYGKAPFFEYYSDDLEAIMFKKHGFLYDLNMDLLTLCLRWLKWKIPVFETQRYEKEPAEAIIDLRSVITPKKPDLIKKFYKPVAYQQVFGNKFVENISLIDLVFCEGPGAGTVVQASTPN
jgi:hypothetical protein